MGVTVNKPGICTTIQDLGRRGYLGSGFSPSGVMDKRAARIANLLVDNNDNAPVLEFCLAGPTLRFTTNTCIALTGGNFSPTVDGAAIPMYAAIMVHRGSVLEFGAPKTGVYGYLAIAGGSIAVPKVMGSASTNLKCGIGGWEGRALSAGDYLPFVTKNVDFLDNLGSHALKDDSFYGFSSDEIVLRVVPGPQEGMFTEQGVNTFFKETYTTTAKCDRMGFRLEGPEIETVNGSDIISDGIALGAVQVPNHGRPIIMLADRQTTGGYAKIGTVASVDIPKLVQCKPGRAIRFEEISVQEAQAACRKEAQEMRSLAKVVKRPCYGGVSPRRTARRLTPILEAQAKKPDITPHTPAIGHRRNKMGKANDEKKQVNMDESTAAREERDRDIRALMALMEEGDLSALRFDDGNVKIELERNHGPLSQAALPLMAERVGRLLDARSEHGDVTTGAQSVPVAGNDSSVTLVKSPLVGTFYVSPSPDEEPFVKVGQEVLTGQTLAIVEAMKMMNEITAPAPGIVTEVLAANGTQVEYDQVLFRIATQASA